MIDGDSLLFRSRLVLLAIWVPVWILWFVWLNYHSADQLHATSAIVCVIASIVLLVATADVFQIIIRRAEFWLSVASVVITLIIAELILAPVMVQNSEQLHILDESTNPSNWFYAPHHYNLYMVNPDFEDVNSRGYRGKEVIMPKPEDRYRIITLGGSTTYGTAVAYWEEAYPAQLQKSLREDQGYSQVEVINGGQPGYNSWETLINLQYRALELDPDLIIIYQNTNDVHARMVPPDQYRSDNSGRRHIWDFDVQRMAESWVWDVPSTLFHQLVLSTGFARLPDNDLEALVSQECTGSETLGCLRLAREDILAANPPIYYERNIRSIIGIAQANGVGVLLLTWAHAEDFTDYASDPAYIAAFAQHNELLEEIASETGTSFYDFAADMPTNYRYWQDGRHMTADGNQLRGELIASYLSESGIIPEQ